MNKSSKTKLSELSQVHINSFNSCATAYLPAAVAARRAVAAAVAGPGIAESGSRRSGFGTPERKATAVLKLPKLAGCCKTQIHRNPSSNSLKTSK